MKRGRPRKLRMNKRFKRRNFGMRRRGAKNPKQMAATTGRRKVRRSRRR